MAVRAQAPQTPSSAEQPPKIKPLPQEIFISEKKGLDNDVSGLTTLQQALEDR
jgi:hypothetical protein